MLKVGLERGNTKNRYICTYIPESDKLTVDSELDSSLVRLSVTCSNEIELRQVLPDLLTEISRKWDFKWQLLTGWNETRQYLSPASVRLKEKNLRDRGFRFTSKDGYRIGLSDRLEKLDDLFCEQLLLRSSYAICVGCDLFAEEIIHACFALVQSSARTFAAPNSSSMAFLTDTSGLLAFVMLADNIRPGVVIVTGEGAKIEEVVVRGRFVGPIYDGGQADGVWAL